MGDEAALAAALKAQHDRDTDPEVSNKARTGISNSLVFQYDWQELLQPVPVALSSISACFVAFAGEAGTSVQLKPPPSGTFKYIE